MKKLIRKIKRYLSINYFPKRKRVIIKNPKIIGSNIFAGYNMVDYCSLLEFCEIGIGSYISFECKLLRAKIGKFCSIGPRVKIGFSTHPIKKWVTTHPAFYLNLEEVLSYTFHTDDTPLFDPYKTAEGKYLASIGNDVWIGADVLIMDGIKVGNGAVIAAGAVVTKDVPSYSIVGGVPAKEIGKRFNESQIEFLNKFKWWDKPVGWIKQNYKQFNDIELFIRNNHKEV